MTDYGVNPRITISVLGQMIEHLRSTATEGPLHYSIYNDDGNIILYLRKEDEAVTELLQRYVKDRWLYRIQGKE